MMRNIATRFACAFLLVAISSPAFADDTVAIVGTRSIMLKDFNQKYEEVQKSTINPPSKEVFLEDLVRYEMGVQEAEKKKLADDPIVKERFRQELYKGLIEKEIGKQISDIKVSEDEMKSYYQKNPEIRTSHILIEFKPEATQAQKEAARDRAKEIYQEVQKSKRPFEELVALYTDDMLSKKTGGDVGWQSGMTLVPNYYETIQKMKIDEVKGLIETQYGYHIVKVTGRHKFDDANKRQIRAAVFDEKRKHIFDEYFAKLKKQYPVKLNKSAIGK
jgi:peptidyl-prolyl cis-trans isomerase C/peptidyl-prolyl cis-trans isomerase D